MFMSGELAGWLHNFFNSSDSQLTVSHVFDQEDVHCLHFLIAQVLPRGHTGNWYQKISDRLRSRSWAGEYTKKFRTTVTRRLLMSTWGLSYTSVQVFSRHVLMLYQYD